MLTLISIWRFVVRVKEGCDWRVAVPWVVRRQAGECRVEVLIG